MGMGTSLSCTGPYWRSKRSYSNKCLVLFCRQRVPPPKIFCEKHWEIVPQRLKQAFAEAYYLGPNAGIFNPSVIKEMQTMTRMIARAEGRPVP